jgi:hypothetical protein
VNDKHVFGSLVGITANEAGKVDGVMTRTWRSILANDIFNNANENVIKNNEPSGEFKAFIEMIKPDGTGRHTYPCSN